MRVIGAGVGRTGTYSLKLAINQLGLGPCHHMEAVLHDMPVQVPLWSDALCGRPDWRRIYSGFASAVDWPTARYFRELRAAYPSARFVLTIRDPEKWADSFAATIYKLLTGWRFSFTRVNAESPKAQVVEPVQSQTTGDTETK